MAWYSPDGGKSALDRTALCRRPDYYREATSCCFTHSLTTQPPNPIKFAPDIVMFARC
eukprot:gene13336-21083_t